MPSRNVWVGLGIIVSVVYGYGVGYKTGRGVAYDHDQEVIQLVQEFKMQIESDNLTLLDQADEIYHLKQEICMRTD